MVILDANLISLDTSKTVAIGQDFAQFKYTIANNLNQGTTIGISCSANSQGVTGYLKQYTTTSATGESIEVQLIVARFQELKNGRSFLSYDNSDCPAATAECRKCSEQFDHWFNLSSTFKSSRLAVKKLFHKDFAL